MTIDPQLWELVRCPACRQRFAERPGRGAPAPAQLTCTGCGRVYPVRDGIPILLVDEATGGPDAGAAAGSGAGG